MARCATRGPSHYHVAVALRALSPPPPLTSACTCCGGQQLRDPSRRSAARALPTRSRRSLRRWAAPVARSAMTATFTVHKESHPRYEKCLNPVLVLFPHFNVHRTLHLSGAASHTTLRVRAWRGTTPNTAEICPAQLQHFLSATTGGRAGPLTIIASVFLPSLFRS